MTGHIGWGTILATALVTSFFTACLTEPVRAWVQRWTKRRYLRRCLYFEIMNNFGALHGQVEMAKRDANMRNGIGERFAMGYKRLAYDMALRDPTTLYGLGYDGLYWIDLLYRDYEHVIHGRFDSGEIRLRNADFTASCILTYLKNRYMSKRLMLRVGPRWFKDYVKQNLPHTPYVEVGPPGPMQRLQRQLDRLQYWSWRSFHQS